MYGPCFLRGGVERRLVHLLLASEAYSRRCYSEQGVKKVATRMLPLSRTQYVVVEVPSRT